MKVVYASSIPSGGPITHLLDLVPRVAGLDIEVSVVCADASVARRFFERGIHADCLPLRNALDLRGAGAVWPVLAGADVVHTHDRRTGLLVRPAARLKGIGTVNTVHGVPESISVPSEEWNAGHASDGAGGHRLDHALSARARILAEALLSRLGTTVVPSHALARFLVSNGFPERRVAVVHNGIEVIRRETAARHEPFAIAAVTLLEPHKAIDVLLDACSRLAFPYTLDVFGDGALRPSLEANAAALGVHAHFHGYVGNTRERIADFDLLVQPSRAENLPMAILEAMAYAVPVVGSRVGGVPELVADGETGLLVAPDDARSLAGAITALHADEARRRAMGSGGAERAAAHFDIADTARRMVEVYRGRAG
jgi:glycosyltransferase involved in cell wall biosynthesis